MNIKTKLALLLTLLVTGILLFFSILVYYFSSSSQLVKFRESLLERAENTAILFVNVSEVDSTLLKKIHQSTILLDEEEIAILDSAGNVLYSNEVLYLSARIKGIIRDDSEISFFSIAKKDGVSYKHHFNNATYTVLVMAYDKYRNENLTELRKILTWSNLSSILLTVVLAYFFSRRAMKPIARIIKSVKEINSNKLSTRLDEGNLRDEIAQLAITFNNMLTDLEIAFKNQQDFVSNASHELRTPLTVMIGESDYILSHERTKEEYISHISELINDLKSLNSLLNSLLELAQVNRDMSVAFSDVRIDEIVFNASLQIKNKYPGRRIVPRIEYPENASSLLIRGNEGLLLIAFRNILDNAFKFSKDDIAVGFEISSNEIKVSIEDKGIGIPQDEVNGIHKPFKRASNARYIGGHGIGLSLVARILELHNADMMVESRENEGTCVKISFNKSLT